MSYSSTQHLIGDLEQRGELVRFGERVDPHLEVAAVQRRLFAEQGPAVLFEQVKGSQFPMLANTFGTLARTEYIFRETLDVLRKVLTLGVEPVDFLRSPRVYLNLRTPRAIWNSRPKWVRRAPVLANRTTLAALPQLVSWQDDGGAYLTLPQVYSESPQKPGWQGSNLGMYRVQISGNDYAADQAGLHYQLQRGIAAHHQAALEAGEPLPVNIFLGGPPAMTLAAVMPLPEDAPELSFAGILAGQRIGLAKTDATPLPVLAEADFCICGKLLHNKVLPEGPFGDHLGYYSLAHDFPVLQVEAVFHRTDAVFPFTVVGHPPQEDSIFTELIQQIVGPLVPRTLPGVKEVRAVEEAGVHPLLLAIGSERYLAYEERRPRELLTLGNALLGSGQLSLAKYLLIVASEDNPALSTDNAEAFLRHLLERVDFSRDLHFQTNTTIDTLDYSGDGFCEGSKVVIAAAGKPRRELLDDLSATQEEALLELPQVNAARLPMPGVLLLSYAGEDVRKLTTAMEANLAAELQRGCPLVVLCNDAEQAASSFARFLWTTFTKSDPARDIFGVGEFVQQKHYGCTGPLVVDARQKPHHAPELVEERDVAAKADAIVEKILART